ncbi:MAG TPA: TetR/AcrR family transcriptional regulator [Pseudolabrys sp.]|jgi:AcrR family transcriptional regulator|nr:TetR/AcrR family transcriptional regulator [Pseudolabrys sp.]
MPYRRTDNVVRRLAAREQAILDSATALAAEGGMTAVQMTAIAARASVAAGTVYRYFPSKADLVAAVIDALSRRELAALRDAAARAPGPLSALAACIATFAARACYARRLIWAATGEPAEAEIDPLRRAFRQSLAAEFAHRIEAAFRTGHLSEVDAHLAASAVLGALLEGLVGPLAPAAESAPAQRQAVQAATLLVLRSLGIVDARARGLVAQCALPPNERAAEAQHVA